ncbi:hypothetical protein [Chitinophaga sp. sic0106]|uniref:hypothetical protein n=1 Tax=Chitinophaga sp. sic0106 TaxID=2854785 RepID=UPI001C49201C|nr:hypothetical protein [Chitinophaga sp. sic0106]MBV7533500.1 hypothetical protein [Chitinophaga sp. sic0106]
MNTIIPEIYSSIHSLLDNYVPPLVPRAGDKSNRYDMYYPYEVELAGRKYPELYFAGVAAYDKYVGLYFFPIYSHPNEFTETPASLRPLLKGKSCFHIKKAESQVLGDIKAMLDKGFEFYQAKGLIRH